MKSKFKRALALCLALVLALSLTVISTGAAGTSPFDLEISDNGDGTLTVSLVGREAMAAFGAADGVMSYNSKYFTLQSIKAGALKDMTANVAEGRFAASAEGSRITISGWCARYVSHIQSSVYWSTPSVSCTFPSQPR